MGGLIDTEQMVKVDMLDPLPHPWPFSWILKVINFTIAVSQEWEGRLTLGCTKCATLIFYLTQDLHIEFLSIQVEIFKIAVFQETIILLIRNERPCPWILKVKLGK